MKTVRITITTTMIEDAFNNEGKDMRDKINSGEFQRDIKSGYGISDCKATWELI